MLPPRPIPEPDPDIIVCDVSAWEADLVTIDTLARLRLTAQRFGCGLRLRGASRELQRIVAFCGLCDVLALQEDELLGRGNGGEAEEREHPGRVEERVDARDPPV